MVSKRLYRSRKHRMIAGVCGGLADYFNIDPVIVRILWIVFFHVGLLAYIVLWIVVPDEPVTTAPPTGTPPSTPTA